MLLLLPFDSHNHIHLGTGTNINPLLYSEDYVQPQQQFSLSSSAAVTKVTEQQQQNDCHNDDTNDLFVQQESQQSQFEQIKASSLSTTTTSSCLSIDMMCISGMAIMSTNINDFMIVKELAHNLVMNHNLKKRNNNNNNPSSSSSSSSFHVIPCFGIHPWWLHELINDHEQWEVYSNNDYNDNDNDTDQLSITTKCHENHNDANINTNCNDKVNDDTYSDTFLYPIWINPLRDALLSTPNSIIGEIGLDGFHFITNIENNTKELSSSILNQMIAFRYQMILGYQLQKPVSIHCVQCYGSLLTIFNELTSTKNDYGLPPKIYFHAFGGKVGVVDQIISCIEQYNQKQISKYKKVMKLKKKKEHDDEQQMNDDHELQIPVPIEVYFGFAPVVNYKSDKTVLVMKHIGIQRIVLETDILEYDNISTELYNGIDYLSNVFNDMSSQDIINITTENSYRLYNIKSCNVPSSLSSSLSVEL